MGRDSTSSMHHHHHHHREHHRKNRSSSSTTNSPSRGDKMNHQHNRGSSSPSPSCSSPGGGQHRRNRNKRPAASLSPPMKRSQRHRSQSYDPIKVGYPANITNPPNVAHDRALVRAMNTELKPNKVDHKSDPGKTLFIGRLNPETTESNLRTHFEKFGEIRSLFLIRDLISGESRRYAFIEFRRSKEADLAYRQGHNTMLDGRRILVDREFGRTMKNWKPRRFGGGFGGHKQSGQMRFGGRTSGSNTFHRIHYNNRGNNNMNTHRAPYHPNRNNNNNNDHSNRDHHRNNGTPSTTQHQHNRFNRR